MYIQKIHTDNACTSGLHKAAIVVDTVLHCLVLAIVVDDEWLPTPAAAVPHGWRERGGRGRGRRCEEDRLLPGVLTIRANWLYV